MSKRGERPSDLPKVPELKAVQPALGHGYLPQLLRAPLSTKRLRWDQPSWEAALGRQGTTPALEEWAVSLTRPVGRACRNTRGTGRLGARAEQTGRNQWKRTATSYPLARTAAGPQGRVSRLGQGQATGAMEDPGPVTALSSTASLCDPGRGASSLHLLQIDNGRDQTPVPQSSETY